LLFVVVLVVVVAAVVVVVVVVVLWGCLATPTGETQHFSEIASCCTMRLVNLIAL
jgi:hypothetical protein